MGNFYTPSKGMSRGPHAGLGFFVFHRRLIAGATSDVEWQREMREKMKQNI
jgi:hypothetical protein